MQLHSIWDQVVAEFKEGGLLFGRKSSQSDILPCMAPISSRAVFLCRGGQQGEGAQRGVSDRKIYSELWFDAGLFQTLDLYGVDCDE